MSKFGHGLNYTITESYIIPSDIKGFHPQKYPDFDGEWLNRFKMIRKFEEICKFEASNVQADVTDKTQGVRKICFQMGYDVS